MQRRLFSLVAIVLIASLTVAHGGTVKHAKPLRPAVHDAEMHGWAARLDVDADARAFDRRIEQQQRDAARFSSPLPSVLHQASPTWLWMTWQWLFSPPSPPPLRTTTWTDATPRFVAYGDSYVANNSFGVPDPKYLPGFTYYNIAFWVSKGGESTGAADNVAEWTRASTKQRKAIVKAYNDAGIRLGVAVFGADDKPQTNGNDARRLAARIAAFVQTYNLQGVDVDYEEYDKFEQRQATKWVIPLTRGLRDALPAEQYYISHAPIAPLFNTDQYPLGYTWVEQDIGALIDYYNVQFYNQDDYATCDSLVHTARGQWPNTALLQLNTKYKIPLSKLVVGKPAHKADADNGYILPDALADCLATQAKPAGWNAGCMWWEYRGNLTRNIAPIKRELKW